MTTTTLRGAALRRTQAVRTAINTYISWAAKPEDPAEELSRVVYLTVIHTVVALFTEMGGLIAIVILDALKGSQVIYPELPYDSV